MNGAIKKNLRREEIIIKENVKLNSVEAVDVPKSYIYANFSYHNIPRVKIVWKLWDREFIIYRKWKKESI